MGYIGAIASVGGSSKNSGSTTVSKKYINEEFESYVANPEKGKMLEDMGFDCVTVGIQDTFMPVEKGDVHSGNTPNLDKAQYNIRERFGYLPERDDT